MPMPSSSLAPSQTVMRVVCHVLGDTLGYLGGLSCGTRHCQSDGKVHHISPPGACSHGDNRVSTVLRQRLLQLLYYL